MSKHRVTHEYVQFTNCLSPQRVELSPGQVLRIVVWDDGSANWEGHWFSPDEFVVIPEEVALSPLMQVLKEG
jgi:hypothetical protein